MVNDDGGRSELMGGLDGPGEADLACRRALESGATFTVSTPSVPVADLVAIYGRRVRHMQDRGITTIGSDTAVARLEAFDGEAVRLGSVHSAEFNFVVFLDVETRAVSCLGVTSSAANPDWDWSAS